MACQADMVSSQSEINTVCMNAVMSCFEKGQQWSGLICLCQVKGWPFVAWIPADSSEVAPFYALKG